MIIDTEKVKTRIQQQYSLGSIPGTALRILAINLYNAYPPAARLTRNELPDGVEERLEKLLHVAAEGALNSFQCYMMWESPHDLTPPPDFSSITPLDIDLDQLATDHDGQ